MSQHETDAILAKYKFTPDERKPVAVVYQTKRYEVFSHIKGNRQIKSGHLRKLIEAFKNKYLKSSIMVNESLAVIDGRHRLAACEELGLPVYFMIVPGYALEEVQILNVNLKNWSTGDFMQTYIDLGVKSYEVYRDFKSQYRLNHSTVLMLLYGITTKSPSILEEFRNGNLKIKDIDKAKLNADMIISMQDKFEGWSKTNFVSAFLTCAAHPKYDHKVFMRKLGNYALRPAVTVNNYKRQIEDIYNRHSHKKHWVRFF